MTAEIKTLSKRAIFQRSLAVLSLVSFFGTTVVAASKTAHQLLTKPAPTEESTQTQTQAPEQQLEVQEQGYEKVLEREPQNPIALEGLVIVRLQMNKAEAALEPLEMLVKLYPDRSDYKALLTEVKQRLDKENKANP